MIRDVTPAQINSSQAQAPNTSYMQSILDLLPEPLASAYPQLPNELTNQSEVTLKTLLNPNNQMEAIRTRIWILVKSRAASRDTARIDLSEIATGIAPISYVEMVLAQQYMVAWCGCPTIDYDTRVESLLNKAYDKLQRILDFPLTDANGEVNTKSANLVIQVAKMLDLRSKGSYIERIEQKTFQVNTTATEARELFRKNADLSLDEIESKIKSLEKLEMPMSQRPGEVGRGE